MKARITVFTLLLIVSLGMSACGSSPAPASPAYALKCDIGTEEYNIRVEGESGQLATEFHGEQTQFGYDDAGRRETITLNVNRTLTYAASGHAYKVSGKIVINLLKNTVSYEIAATGGGLGDKGQTCKNT
jgi:YD repeat-containing protein